MLTKKDVENILDRVQEETSDPLEWRYRDDYPPLHEFSWTATDEDGEWLIFAEEGTQRYAVGYRNEDEDEIITGGDFGEMVAAKLIALAAADPRKALERLLESEEAHATYLSLAIPAE